VKELFFITINSGIFIDGRLKMAKKIEKPQGKIVKGEKKKTTRRAKPKVEKKQEPDVIEVQMIQEEPKPEAPVRHSDRGALILGAGLLILGIILLSGELLGFPFGEFLWPFIFIVPGVLIFLSALSTKSRSGEGLAILGSILTMLGFVFFLQTTFNLWASWAYAWALIAPTSIGFSQIVYGTHKGHESMARSGRRLMSIGLTMFAIGFIFFELVIGLSGFGLDSFGIPTIPVALILIGVLILIRTFIRVK